MNFINGTKESPYIDVIETIILVVGVLILIFVLSAIAGVVYALFDMCKPQALCQLYNWSHKL